MLSIRKATFFFAVLAGTLFLTACPSQTNIGKINSDPGRYSNKEVGIVGRVTDSYGVLEMAPTRSTMGRARSGL